MDKIKLLTLKIVFISFISIAMAENSVPSADSRLALNRSYDHPYSLFNYSNRQAWSGRAKYLKEHISVCNGLWPHLEQTPINARIFDTIERDGYSIEKVYFESCPGFYVVGNLYRPLGKAGPFPAILNPHGHWPNGRFENNETVSVPGRCINFALQGYIAFSYSMMGFNESSLQIKHDALAGDKEQLWGISPMAIQTRASICALDFILSLPDTDSNRIGITGASGGGTQTFIASVIEDRIHVAAPVNMISMYMQGGCICENAPALRIDACNPEIAAVIAPRPLLMISTSGDWTSATPQMEFPAVRNIYHLFNADESVANAHFDYPHNYNKDAREAVYAWFAKWLQPGKDIPAKETAFKVEDVNDLKVFKTLPQNAISAEQLRAYLIEQSAKAIHSRLPDNWGTLLKFREEFLTVYRHSLNVSTPNSEDLLSWYAEQTAQAAKFYLGRRGKGDRIPAVLLYPVGKINAVTLLADANGLKNQLDGLLPRMGSLSSELIARGHLVMVIHPFPAESTIPAIKDEKYVAAYNRTPAAEAIQDILTAAAYLETQLGYQNIRLAGIGDAGLTVFLAGGLLPQAACVAADINGFNNQSDDDFLKKLNIPLLRRAGDLTTAAALAAPKPLMLFNLKEDFNSSTIKAIYKAAGAENLLCIERNAVSKNHIADWLK